MKIISTTILFICLNLSALGQDLENKGYIIDLGGNEIAGAFDPEQSMRFPTIIRFKVDQETDFRQYTPNDILAFRNGSNNFESTLTYGETEPRFIKILVSGPKSLYQFKSNAGKNFFYVKIDDQLVLLESERATNNLGYDLEATLISFKYKGQLQAYLNDCDGIKTSTTKHSRISLEKLFKQYYECTSQNSDYSTDIEEQSYDIDFIAGYSFMNYQFPFFEHRESLGTPELGIGFYHTLPGTNKKWAFRLELLVSRFQSDRTYTTTITTERIYTEQIENLIVETETTPNSSRYNSLFIANNIFISRQLSNRLSLQAGFSNIIGFDKESPKTLFESYVDDEYVWSRDTSPKPRFYSFAPAAGLSWKMGKLNFSARYHRIFGPYTNYLKREDSDISQLHKIQLLLAYKIK